MGKHHSSTPLTKATIETLVYPPGNGNTCFCKTYRISGWLPKGTMSWHDAARTAVDQMRTCIIEQGLPAELRDNAQNSELTIIMSYDIQFIVVKDEDWKPLDTVVTDAVFDHFMSS